MARRPFPQRNPLRDSVPPPPPRPIGARLRQTVGRLMAPLDLFIRRARTLAGRAAPLPQTFAFDTLEREVQALLAAEMPRHGPALGPVVGVAPARDLLTVHDLRKSYRGRAVVSGANLALRRGEAVGLLGPNGAGKTTIFYIITGLVKPDGGSVELDGFSITHLPMYRRARLGLGYLPQEASIFRGLSVEDNIRAVLEVVEPNAGQRAEDLERLLDEFHIAHVRRSPAIALSGGERRRCEIARALAGRPSFMLLDEPFAGIDPIAVGDIQQLVRQLTRRGIGVLVTDHNVRETLGLIDRAYIINAGEVLFEGAPQDIVASPDVRRLYLGERFSL